MIQHLQLTVGNIHCQDCVAKIREILGKKLNFTDIDPDNANNNLESIPSDKVIFWLKDGSVNLNYKSSESDPTHSPLRSSVKQIVQSLKNNGFTISSWTLDQDSSVILSSEHESSYESQTSHDSTFHIQDLWKKYKRKQLAKHHMEVCTFCQMIDNDSDDTKVDANSDMDTESGKKSDDSDIEYRAVFSIAGMSCASCVSSISEAISTVLKEHKIEMNEEEPQFSVNLLQGSAILLVPDKQIVNDVIKAIEDSGFSAKLVETLPIKRSMNIKVVAVIGGITCAACVNSIMTSVNQLPFVLDCGINPVTKSGQFIIEGTDSGNSKNLEKLKQTVEDCGFDFELVKQEKIGFTSPAQQSRTINIKIDGMYCKNCPTAIMAYLQKFGDAVVIEDPITLDQPLVKFNYVPNAEQNITARRFLKDLNHLNRVPNDPGFVIDYNEKGAFTCDLVEALSIEDHLRAVSKKETMGIVRRLVLATVLAIPTLIFGVIGMSLISSRNSFRKWLTEPLWTGNVSRAVWILFFLSTPAYFFAADIFHLKAIKEIRSLWTHKNSFRKRFFKFGSMSLLMSTGTTVAYVASIVLLILASQTKAEDGFHTTYFDSVVFLSFFLLVGRLLESYSKSKTAEAVSDLSSFKTSNATVVEKIETESNSESFKYGNDEVVDLKLLDYGELIRISPGESPAVDCVIVDGSTEFDESAISGESNPIKHKVGQQIFSGTINAGNTSVVAKVLNTKGKSLIDQIVSTVRDGQMRKAPIQRAAEVLTGYFVPVIVLIAILTWLIWLILAYGGALPSSYLDIDVGGWAVWSLEFAIAVFVVACPCGIGLAAPTALFVGSGLAAKYGILAKGGGTAFQDAAVTNLVCFDKTGTLTKGQMKVADVAFVKFENETENLKRMSLQFTRDLELASKHPIGEAVKAYLSTEYGRQFSSNKLPNVETVPGKGLRGSPITDSNDEEIWIKYKPEEVILGNKAMLEEHNLKLNDSQQKLCEAWNEEKKSLVLVAVKCSRIFKDQKFHVALMLACRDEIRPESKLVVETLQKQGVECWMITGDNRITAAAIGKELGIAPENIVSEVLPDGKDAKIQSLRTGIGKVVAMVGDGINDAPALSSADVGIAVSSGTDIALTSSDFILLSKQYPLLTLFTLFDLSKVVFRRVKFNFAWSLIYNVIGVPIAAGVIYPYKNSRLDPVWASAAMAASSLSVVTSSLLLRLYRPKLMPSELEKQVLQDQKDVKVHYI